MQTRFLKKKYSSVRKNNRIVLVLRQGLLKEAIYEQSNNNSNSINDHQQRTYS